ncbi:hypothetical protein ACLVWU_09600 [Bdellovibrio sp. HCB290]|uniref:hypothetical protein n=1 Tax=Bdellovibrio sp. HCB290 TaxID=3394356 RepID=UPI0039B49087
MKKLILLAPFLLLVLGGQTAFAANKAKKAEGPKAQLGTSFKFDGSALRGKYQSSLNTKATVENDKLLEDLLAGRKEFNDRIQDDQNRN